MGVQETTALMTLLTVKTLGRHLDKTLTFKGKIVRVKREKEQKSTSVKVKEST